MGQIEQKRPIFSTNYLKNKKMMCSYSFSTNSFLWPTLLQNPNLRIWELLVMLASHGSGILSHLGKIHSVMICLYLKSQRKVHSKLDEEMVLYNRHAKTCDPLDPELRNFHGRCPLGRGRHDVKELYVCMCQTLLSKHNTNGQDNHDGYQEGQLKEINLNETL